MLIARCHDIVIAERSEADTQRRFSTQRVTRSASPHGSLQSLHGQRCAIVANVQAYATPVPAGQNTLNAIRNYATIADASGALFERIPCCAGRGVTAVTP